MIVPPEVVRHMEYSVRAQERKEELELVRRKSLAKPQTARLKKATVPTEVTFFHMKQRELFQEQRQRKQDALEFLHNYRACKESILRRTRWLRSDRKEFHHPQREVEAFAQEVEAFVQKLEMEGEPAVEYKEGGPLVEYKERTLALLRDVISIPSLIALATVLKKDNCDRILLCKIFLTRTVFSIGVISFLSNKNHATDAFGGLGLVSVLCLLYFCYGFSHSSLFVLETLCCVLRDPTPWISERDILKASSLNACVSKYQSLPCLLEDAHHQISHLVLHASRSCLIQISAISLFLGGSKALTFRTPDESISWPNGSINILELRSVSRSRAAIEVVRAMEVVGAMRSTSPILGPLVSQVARPKEVTTSTQVEIDPSQECINVRAMQHLLVRRQEPSIYLEAFHARELIVANSRTTVSPIHRAASIFPICQSLATRTKERINVRGVPRPLIICEAPFISHKALSSTGPVRVKPNVPVVPVLRAASSSPIYQSLATRTQESITVRGAKKLLMICQEPSPSFDVIASGELIKVKPNATVGAGLRATSIFPKCRSPAAQESLTVGGVQKLLMIYQERMDLLMICQERSLSHEASASREFSVTKPSATVGPVRLTASIADIQSLSIQTKESINVRAMPKILMICQPSLSHQTFASRDLIEVEPSANVGFGLRAVSTSPNYPSLATRTKESINVRGLPKLLMSVTKPSATIGPVRWTASIADIQSLSIQTKESINVREMLKILMICQHSLCHKTFAPRDLKKVEPSAKVGFGLRAVSTSPNYPSLATRTKESINARRVPKLLMICQEPSLSRQALALLELIVVMPSAAAGLVNRNASIPNYQSLAAQTKEYINIRGAPKLLMICQEPSISHETLASREIAVVKLNVSVGPACRAVRAFPNYQYIATHLKKAMTARGVSKHLVVCQEPSISHDVFASRELIAVKPTVSVGSARRASSTFPKCHYFVTQKQGTVNVRGVQKRLMICQKPSLSLHAVASGEITVVKPIATFGPVRRPTSTFPTQESINVRGGQKRLTICRTSLSHASFALAEPLVEKPYATAGSVSRVSSTFPNRQSPLATQIEESITVRTGQKLVMQRQTSLSHAAFASGETIAVKPSAASTSPNYPPVAIQTQESISARRGQKLSMQCQTSLSRAALASEEPIVARPNETVSPVSSAANAFPNYQSPASQISSRECIRDEEEDARDEAEDVRDEAEDVRDVEGDLEVIRYVDEFPYIEEIQDEEDIEEAMSQPMTSKVNGYQKSGSNDTYRNKEHQATALEVSLGAIRVNKSAYCTLSLGVLPGMGIGLGCSRE